MKRIIQPLVVRILVSFGCSTIPGQDVRFVAVVDHVHGVTVLPEGAADESPEHPAVNRRVAGSSPA